MDEYKVNIENLDRFISAFHAQTGTRLDRDLALLYFEITKDRKVVIESVNNSKNTVEAFIKNEKSFQENILKEIIVLQKGIENLSLKTDEKKTSLSSLLLRVHHRLGTSSKIIFGSLLAGFCGLIAFLTYHIYLDFESLKQHQEFSNSIEMVNGKQYQAIKLKNGSYVKKRTLYIPIK
ncbi:hypothetical protein LV89_04923 [Arcicella aurantiaca]|uniref:Uncharacterized protein n=2 Tax=Arcicella aurantiaca TaxID=591202 RepID=A0A316DEV1_9BACT|nr:hypothetical protein LV89_04923 [Arcicella aurantiaca]